MKKLLFLLTAALICTVVIAQGSKPEVIERKSMLVFHLGPSFPVGDFVSHDMNLEDPGFAKIGVQFGLNYAYQFYKNAGITAAIFYNRFNLDKSAIEVHNGTGINADHWQFYGITAGPMLTFELTKKVLTDLRVMGGLCNINSPAITYENDLIVKGDWKWAPVFQGGLDLRFVLNNNVFLFTNADYQYKRPRFELTSADGSFVEPLKQHMANFNLTGGVGIKF